MRRVRWENRVYVDTESNLDGSLYIISYYNPDKEEYKLFYDLDSFYDYLTSLNESTLCYVHNFGKWDSYFLLHGKFLDNLEDIVNKDKQILKYIISYDSNLRNKNRSIKKKFIGFEDTLPKTMISLKKFAESIDEPYEELPTYDTYREPGKPETWVDREEIEAYAKKDVYILYRLTQAFRQVYGDNFDKSLTAGSLVWKEVVNNYAPSAPRFAYKNFRNDIIELESNVDSFIRLGYMGGITTPFYGAGVVLDSKNLKQHWNFKNPVIRGDDISSAYAWAQIRELPFGKFFTYNKKDLERVIFDESKTVFFKIKFSYSSCDFPVIPKMNMTYEKHLDIDTFKLVNKPVTAYMTTMLNGNEGEAVVSSVDLNYAIKNNVYKNLKYEFLEIEDGIYGYGFYMKKNKHITDITNKYYELKNTATDNALRFAYKAPLVNIYGKTGEKIHTTKTELDIETRETTEVDLEKERPGRYANVAVASTITSYVHHKLYERAKEVGFKNILYCDTDSLFYVCEDEPLKVIPEALGVWNNDVDNVHRALFICPKKYVIDYYKNGKLESKTASAGISKEDKSFNIDNWMNGKRHYYKKERVIKGKGLALEKKVVDASASFFPTYWPGG